MISLMFAGLLGLALPLHHPPSEAAGCEQAMQTHSWCAKCDSGRVASVEIKSRLLYDALDTHGHHFPADEVECESCRAGLEEDGYCDVHAYGFVHGHAYMTKLTYLIAKGKTLKVAAIACETCRGNADPLIHEAEDAPPETGWCDACKVGMVGNVALSDPEQFKQAHREFRSLLAAVKTAERCELCAAAMLYDSRCSECKITYKDGEPVKPAKGAGQAGGGE